MVSQFKGIGDRALACGHGVPDERLASECAARRATIIIDDAMPDAMTEEVLKKKPPKRPATKKTETRNRRTAKLFRLPIPLDLLADEGPDVELRVTLSYFAELNKFGRKVYHGLDLKWDMQGPQEDEAQFLQRVNKLMRPEVAPRKRAKSPETKSFDWVIGIQRRSRGTVQSDRWKGRLSQLAGDKLIAVVPVLGWWDQRSTLKYESMPFSLIVSVFGPDVYAAIKPKLEVPVEATIAL